jgi:hypothetical protein
MGLLEEENMLIHGAIGSVATTASTVASVIKPISCMMGGGKMCLFQKREIIKQMEVTEIKPSRGETFKDDETQL